MGADSTRRVIALTANGAPTHAYERTFNRSAHRDEPRPALNRGSAWSRPANEGPSAALNAPNAYSPGP